MKKCKKFIAFLVLSLSLFTISITAFASSYAINFNFDSNLYGKTRYYGNGKAFTIETSASCPVYTYFDIELHKCDGADSFWGPLVGKSWNSANTKDSAHIGGTGAGYYYVVFRKAKNTYGKYCTGTGVIRDN